MILGGGEAGGQLRFPAGRPLDLLAEEDDPLLGSRERPADLVLTLDELPEPGAVETAVPVTFPPCSLRLLQLRSAGDGRLIDPAASQGLGHDVLRRFLALHDHERFVAVAAPGHRHVDTPGVAGSIEEEEGTVDGATLSGVAGLGVGQLDVLSDVVGGKADGAGATGDAQGTVVVNGENVPSVAVLHHRSAVGPHLAIVASGGNSVTDVQSVAAHLDRRPGEVDLAGLAPHRLRPVVESHHRFVGRRHHRCSLTPGSGLPPGGHDRLLHPPAAPAMNAAVVVVSGEHVRVSPTQLQACLPLPTVDEAVDTVELDRPVAVDEVAKHSRAPHRRELHRVADEGQSPAPAIGEVGELCQARCRNHGRLVHHHRGPCGKVVAVVRRTLQAVLDEEPVEGVRGQPGVIAEYFSGRGRRGYAKHRPSLGAQLLDGRSERSGLAGARRPHDQDQLAAPRDRGGHFALGAGEIVVSVDAEVLAASGEASVGPVHQALLLGQDLSCREHSARYRLGDGATVSTQSDAVGDGPRQLDEALGHDPIGEAVQPRHECFDGDSDVGRDGSGEFPDQLSRPP